MTRRYWTADSDLKHYYNYLESKEDDEDDGDDQRMIADIMKIVLRELVKKHGPRKTKRGTVDKDGWETVV